MDKKNRGNSLQHFASNFPHCEGAAFVYILVHKGMINRFLTGSGEEILQCLFVARSWGGWILSESGVKVFYCQEIWIRNYRLFEDFGRQFIQKKTFQGDISVIGKTTVANYSPATWVCLQPLSAYHSAVKCHTSYHEQQEIGLT